MSKSLTAVQREYVNAMSREASHLLNRAFEQITCRCSPLRQQCDAIRKERTAFVETRLKEFNERVVQEYQREFGRHSGSSPDTNYYVRDILDNDPEIKSLEEEIDAIDAVDHPKAHKVDNVARPFFRAWLVGAILEGRTLAEEPEDVAQQYAEAWTTGWRPLK